MSYTIIWTSAAFEQMDRLMQAMPERHAVFAATLKTIAAVLRTSPADVGESREGLRRVWFVDNLLMSFDVDDDDDTVLIQSVRLASRT